MYGATIGPLIVYVKLEDMFNVSHYNYCTFSQQIFGMFMQ